MQRLIALIFAGIGFTSIASAQQPKVLAPHRPVPPRLTEGMANPTPATKRSVVGGLWMIDANFKSTIYLHNNNEKISITATPILYLSNGKRFVLPNVLLQPAGTAVVSVNDVLRDQGIASWATLSGYVEVQYTSPYDPVCVMVNDVDVVHSLIFTSGLRPALPLPSAQKTISPGSQTIEGMWWKEEAKVSGFVALSNTTTQSLEGMLRVTDSAGKPLGEHTVSVSPHGTKIVRLEELQSTGDRQGGLRVSYDGPADAFGVVGHLQDADNGYSASIPFTHAPSSSGTVTTTSFAELGLMSGAADPMLLFPAGTVFTPFSVVHNMSDTGVKIKPEFYWMEAGKSRSGVADSFVLGPLETKTLDVQGLLARSGLSAFDGSVNLVLETEGKANSLLVASGSVDQKKTYVFQGVPRSVQQSQAKTISYWSTGNGDDTMVSVWNPADEPQDFVFTLFFTGGHYDFPIHLEPRATRMFNISEIIQNQIPDHDGNIIPSSVHEGSAKLAGSLSEVQDILVALDAGTYNVRKATCSYYCITCTGYYDLLLGIVPFSVAKGGTNQLTLTGEYSSGSNINLTSSATWSSSSTAVATVATGKVAGVNPGTANISSLDSEPLATTYCAYDPGSCSGPYQNFSNGGQGTVPPNPTITGVAFSAGLTLGAGGLMTITGTNFSSFLGALSVIFNQGITTSNATVANSTTITANYLVTCSTIAGGNSFYVSSAGGDGGAGAQTNSWPVTVTLPSAPPPTIKLAGNNVSGTQSVVVGQQIALSSSPSLPVCMSLSSQQWSVPPGTAVGGYPASISSGSVAPLPSSTGATYTFYWVYPGNSYNMTYNYTMSGGGANVSSPVATATFNVAGPSNGKMTTTHTGAVGIQPINGNPYLQFGTLSATNAGVLFTPSATAPSGYSNTFVWVQLVSQDTIVANGSSCSAGTGLDNAYPYPPVVGTNTAGDSPAVALLATDTTVSRTFAAQMYLLWSSGLANSIPVPLGATSWSFSGTATKSGSTWSASGSGSAGTFAGSNASQAHFGYPVWTSHTTNGVCHSDTN